MSVDSSRLVFVAGLHRSGTTPLAKMLADHPQVSGLTATGVTEDEGQHLQPVYPPARAYGGAGRFAWNERAHLTDESPLVSPANAARLIEAWSPYWDLNRPFLLEKSPPNLLMGRFLQALFPGSAFVVVMRHPVVVALSTKKWTRRTSLKNLVGHWFTAHDTFFADLPRLSRVTVMRYEDLISEPAEQLSKVQQLLGLAEPVPLDRLQASRSSVYEQQWDALSSGGIRDRRRRAQIEDEFGARCAEFGYDVSDLQARKPWSFEPATED